MTNSKKPGPVSDELLREALRCELNDIEPPPPEMMWNRIQDGLSRGKKAAPPRRRLNWFNFSAAAAALLVFVIGTVHLYNNLQLRAPQDEISIMRSESSDFFSAGNDCTEMTDRPYDWLVPVDPSKRASLPLPDSINEHFVLEQAGTRQGPGGEQYDMAIYSSEDDVRLFWVSAVSTDPDLLLFLVGLSTCMEVEFVTAEPTGGVLYFSVDDRPGLAWHEDGFTYAVWVITGDLSHETLLELLN